MRPKRNERLADLLKEEISYIIQTELKDPRVGFVTITHVEVSEDLRHARVYVSILGGQKEIEASAIGLGSAQGFIRGKIGQRLKLRYVPEIAFKLDQSGSYGARIEELLARLKDIDPTG